MKMKLGNSVLFIIDLLPFCLVHTISISIANKTAVIPPAMQVAKIMNMEHSVGLCLQVDGNQFQYFL
jgi:hypothetical protein